MKKKLVYLLVIMLSFLFVQSIEAKVCEYETIKNYWKNYNSSTKNECSDRHATSSFTMPTSDNADATPTLTLKYNAWKCADPFCTSSKDAYRTINKVKILNWNSEHYDLEKFGSKSGGECPKFLVVVTSVLYTGGTGDDTVGAFAMVKDEDDPEAVVEKIVKTEKQYFKGESFFFIQKYIPTEEEKIEEATTYESCKQFKSASGTAENKYLDGCLTNEQYSCMWVRKKVKGKKDPVEYCNFDSLTYVRCGDIWDLPDKLPGIVSFIVNFAKIVTPIILVLVSIISLVKAVASSKEEDINKAKSTLIRRLIAAVIVFFVIQMTQFVILIVADNTKKDANTPTEADNLSSCLSCFLNNDCNDNRYYKTLEGGKYICTNLNGTEFEGECH